MNSGDSFVSYVIQSFDFSKKKLMNIFVQERLEKNVAIMMLCQWLQNKIPKHGQNYGM